MDKNQRIIEYVTAPQRGDTQGAAVAIVDASKKLYSARDGFEVDGYRSSDAFVVTISIPTSIPQTISTYIYDVDDIKIELSLPLADKINISNYYAFKDDDVDELKYNDINSIGGGMPYVVKLAIDKLSELRELINTFVTANIGAQYVNNTNNI